MRAVPRQQLVPSLLVARPRRGEELRREEALDEVVDAAVAVPSGQPQDPGLGERLEDGPDRVRRPPVPVDGRAWLDVRGRQRAVAPDAVEQFLDQRCVYVEGARAVLALAEHVPRDAIPGHLRGRDDGQALVVGLVERPRPVQVAVGPVTAVAIDPGAQDEVVVATGDVEWIELERPDPVDDGHHAGRGRGAASAAASGGGAGRGNRRAVARSRAMGSVTGPMVREARPRAPFIRHRMMRPRDLATSWTLTRAKQRP